MSKICSIGSVPNDFIDLKLKDLADTKVMNSFTDGDWIESKHMSCSGVRLIQTGNIGVGKFIEKDNKKYISEKTFNELKCKEVKEGDILICRLADPIGRSCIIPKINSKLITSVDVALLRINKKYFDNKYINYYFNFEKHLNTINSFASGTTRQRISRGNLGEVKVAVPPLKEQQKIAEILSSVDAAIEKTEQVIAKTEEVKKGLMQQLLTKGIGHTEFKRTEIGEIPVEWNLMKIEEFTSVKTGGTPSKKQQSYWENGNIPWMSSGEIHKKYIRDVDEYITIEGYNNSNVSILPKGAVMMALNGQGKTRGTVAILETETTCNQSLAAILPNDTVNEYFLYHLLDSKYQELRAITGDGARTGLNLSLIRNIIIQVPSIKEQLKIVQIINAIDVKLQSEKKNQKKLEVLKTALMQQLLTGKTRVKID